MNPPTDTAPPSSLRAPSGRTCRHCGDPIPLSARQSQVFCDAGCRMAHYAEARRAPFKCKRCGGQPARGDSPTWQGFCGIECEGAAEDDERRRALAEGDDLELDDW